MSRDRYEKKPRRTRNEIRESVEMMAGADFENSFSLAAAMGLVRCVHGEQFPCAQCSANRRWNEVVTGTILSEREFERRYTECADDS